MHIRLWTLLFLVVAGLEGLAQPQEEKSPWYEFSPDGKECIIRNADLPTPWFNRLSNDVFSTWVSHNGFVESYLLDPVWNGLTNPENTSGHFYIRDRSTGSFFQVNKPVRPNPWECRVGLGYNKITNTVNGIRSSVTYFVPRDGNALIMLLELTNITGLQKEMDVFGEVEWNLGDPVKHIVYRADGRGGSQFNLYKKVSFRNNTLFASQPNWRSTGTCIPWPYTGFFTVNEKIASFETIKNKFLGTGMDYDQPEELMSSGEGSGTEFWSQSDYPIGMLHNRVTLQPGVRKVLTYTLGMARTEEEVQALIDRYRSVDDATRALAEVKAYYDNFVNGSVVVETPDKENDRIINTWTKYQWRQFYKKSLNSGGYGLGLWSYGLEGETIRTCVEQVILPFDRNIIGNSIINHFKHQLSDTSQSDLSISEHTLLYKDLGLPGPDTAYKGTMKVTHRHKIAEFLYPIYFYLLETGDLKLLDTVLPYLDGKQATVWEHIRTALTIAVRCVGPRGLPNIPTGHGDWMDEFTRISKDNGAESVMLAGELGFILRGFSNIARMSGHSADAEKWMAVYEKMKKAVNDLAWDGDWYIRAFSDRGNPPIPVGTKTDAEGKIYLNAQSWSILSGIAPADRAEKALASVEKMLVSDFGPKIFSPSYSHYVDYIGTQSLYAPGFRNGCIYLRPTGWSIIAACLMGNAALANELYNKAALKTRAGNIEQFQCEPYVYPELYNGPDHRLKGKGEFQWNLGEGAAWMWYSYVNYILGVRPEFGGLRIDPHIPAEWSGFIMKRDFRGGMLHIEVKNKNRVSMGVKSVLVNGKKIKGNLITGIEKGKEYHIIVTL